MKKMKIDVYCVDGSPTGVIPADIHERGVGGAELALMTWAECMAQRGHRISVYNDPRIAGTLSGVWFRPRSLFKPEEERDVFIAFRGGNPHLGKRCAPKMVFWSCDQQTAGNYDIDVFPWVDFTVTISSFHTRYFLSRYRGADISKMTHIDIGVRTWEYQDEVPKVPYQMIFCSVPDRGLSNVALAWSYIRHHMPEATLVVTSDYRLWGVDYPGDEKYRALLKDAEGVRYLGKVPRKELVHLQMQSDLMYYPCTYEEMFCIAAAECQVAGAIPVTTHMGALNTTAAFGYKVAINRVAQQAVELLLNRKMLQQQQLACRERALSRFAYDRICTEWEVVLQ